MVSLLSSSVCSEVVLLTAAVTRGQAPSAPSHANARRVRTHALALARAVPAVIDTIYQSFCVPWARDNHVPCIGALLCHP